MDGGRCLYCKRLSCSRADRMFLGSMFKWWECSTIIHWWCASPVRVVQVESADSRVTTFSSVNSFIGLCPPQLTVKKTRPGNMSRLCEYPCVHTRVCCWESISSKQSTFNNITNCVFFLCCCWCAPHLTEILSSHFFVGLCGPKAKKKKIPSVRSWDLPKGTFFFFFFKSVCVATHPKRTFEIMTLLNQHFDEPHLAGELHHLDRNRKWVKKELQQRIWAVT